MMVAQIWLCSISAEVGVSGFGVLACQSTKRLTIYIDNGDGETCSDRGRQMPFPEPVDISDTVVSDIIIRLQNYKTTNSIDSLLARPDLDPKRLAYVGHSYGAQWGSIFSAVDRQFISVFMFSLTVP
jgi:hypothetical protein